MKRPLETARRWLAQAEYSLRMTRSMVEGGFGAGACFHAEQTAQLALKAFLFSAGRRFVNIHSVRELAINCSNHDQGFAAFVEYGLVLDRYYLPTRYPDVLPEPAVPFESFTRQDADQALEFVEETLELVRANVADQ
ncbi:MAG: HEPN domain-containing protein [Dehalococcoidia bacterium]